MEKEGSQRNEKLAAKSEKRGSELIKKRAAKIGKNGEQGGKWLQKFEE